MNRNIRIARQLVRLAKSLVAMTDDEQEQACKDFPGLESFFMQCLIHQVPDEKQDAFVSLLRKPGQTIKEDDYERFTNVNPFEFGKTVKWLDYLGLIDFSTLNDFNDFIDNYTTRQNYATNAQTSPDILVLLAYDENQKVSDAALANDSFPVDKMMEIVETGNDRMKMNIANKKNTPSDVLEKLSYDGNPFIRAHVASHENTPVNVLERMLEDSDPDVLSSIASNKKIPAELLVRLDGLVETLPPNKQSNLRRVIASNPKTDLDIIRKITLNTSDPSVQKVILKRNDIPSDLIDIIAGSKDSEVRCDAAKHCNASVETLTRLSNDRIVNVRISVLENPNTPPEIYGNLARDKNVSVRIDVAHNEKTPPEALRLLSSDTIWNVRMWVATNPSTPLDVLRKLSKSQIDSIRRYAIGNMEKRAENQNK